MNLDELLQIAAAEPAYRAEFYKHLLEDDLFIVTRNTGLEAGDHTLETEKRIDIVTFTDGRIPIFTRLERIYDKGIVTEQVEYIQMKGETLLSIAKGATFLLNPYSDVGKELTPPEVESLLDGSYLSANARTSVTQKDTKIMIGQPANYPSEIVNSLSVLFAAKPEVQAAYLAWFHDPQSGEAPHFLFGIDAAGDIQPIIQEAGFTVQQFLPENEFADFIQIDDQALSAYLTNTAPFYKRV